MPSKVFKANYRGRCPNCDGPIKPGESVRYDDDSDLVHSRHEDDPPSNPDPLALHPTTSICCECGLAFVLNKAGLCPDCADLLQ